MTSIRVLIFASTNATFTWEGHYISSIELWHPHENWKSQNSEIILPCPFHTIINLSSPLKNWIRQAGMIKSFPPIPQYHQCPFFLEAPAFWQQKIRTKTWLLAHKEPSRWSTTKELWPPTDDWLSDCLVISTCESETFRSVVKKYQFQLPCLVWLSKYSCRVILLW